MNRSLVLLGLCLVVAALGDAAGCASSKRNQFAAGTGGTTGSNSSASASGGSSLSGLGTGGGSCGGAARCSSDLHSLLDCDGNVIKTCPADQGCSGSACVPACQAAQDNKSSLGCAYYAVDPATDGPLDGQGGCFVSYVANTWTTPVTLAVSFGTRTLDPASFAYTTTGSGSNIKFTPLSGGIIPAGQVAVLFLADLPGATQAISPITCPASVSTAITDVDAATHGTAIGTAFYLTVTAPVAAFDIFPYGGGSAALTSASLLLPTSAWDTNYVAVTAFGPGLGFGAFVEDAPYIDVVAQENDTKVTINPVAAIAAGTGVAAAPAGVPTTYTIQQGQVLQFLQAAPLDGSVLTSNNPIGVWGGKTAVSIVACCDDTAHQQIPPVRALGSEYVGVRYRNRYAGTEESPPWRIIGAANGTTLTWEPAVPVGAPMSLSVGQVTTFNTNGPFVVKSQDAAHPFYMSAHMTGGALYDPSQQCGGTGGGGTGGSNASCCPDVMPDGRGDAEFVNVIPPDEYLDSYVFFTDPTYPETDLVIVRTKGPKGFQDVNLDCAGTLGGWQPAGTSGKYEYTRFNLVTGNFVGTGACNNGRHAIKSAAPFGVTVWGWGSAATGQMFSGFYSQYVSYAYPAGAGVSPINQVYIPTTAM